MYKKKFKKIKNNNPTIETRTFLFSLLHLINTIIRTNAKIVKKNITPISSNIIYNFTPFLLIFYTGRLTLSINVH